MSLRFSFSEKERHGRDGNTYEKHFHFMIFHNVTI